MSSSDIISMCAAALGFAGSAVLAFSLNSVLDAMRFGWNAHELAITGLLSTNDPVVKLEGVEKRHDRAWRFSRRLTQLGLGMLVVSFGLQFYLIVHGSPASQVNQPATKASP